MIDQGNCAAFQKDACVRARTSGQKVRLQSTRNHLRDARLRVSCQPNRNRQLPPNFVFEDPQRLIQISNHKVDQPRAQSRAKPLSLCIDAKRTCARDARSDDSRDAIGVEPGSQQQLSSDGISKVLAANAAKGEVSIVDPRAFGKGKHRPSYSATLARLDYYLSVARRPASDLRARSTP